MTKNILMIPFHYPPMSGSSGVQRSLFFSTHLSDYGWNPTVLSAHPRVHPNVSDEAIRSIPDSLVVKRVFAIDVAKHLPFGGRYPKYFAIPDRWSSWVIAAVFTGYRIIKKHKPKIIWSTYPIASSHLIAIILYKLTKIQWVADFRDPMTEESYPEDPLLFKVYRWIEKYAVTHASYVVVTTQGVKKVYSSRYSVIDNERIKVIPNGYDESLFKKVESKLSKNNAKTIDAIRLVHSGLIYPEERNPIELFTAIAELKKQDLINAEILQVELRATGFDEYYKNIIEKFFIQDIVQLLPAISHEQCIEDMYSADALLLLQASNCNDQIPAKVYEYLRVGKPIVALTDPDGDTGEFLKKVGVKTLAKLDDKKHIKDIILNLKEISNHGVHYNQELIANCSRQHQTKELALILNSIC